MDFKKRIAGLRYAFLSGYIYFFFLVATTAAIPSKAVPAKAAAAAPVCGLVVLEEDTLSEADEDLLFEGTEFAPDDESDEAVDELSELLVVSEETSEELSLEISDELSEDESGSVSLELSGRLDESSLPGFLYVKPFSIA